MTSSTMIESEMRLSGAIADTALIVRLTRPSATNLDSDLNFSAS